MSESEFGDESFALLADLEGVESAAGYAESVRRQRRLRGEPAMSRKEALHRANEYLRADGSLNYIADAKTATPNGLQNLWIISYFDRREPDVSLMGGGLVVESDGEVRPLSSVPGQPEMVGVKLPAESEDAWLLPDAWDEHVHDRYPSSEWAKLIEFVETERSENTVYPDPEHMFHAFRLTDFADVRVVILGQDPYHGPDQAHGLAFSVAQGSVPPSLRKVFAELERDSTVSVPSSGNLEGWAKQGVLLLNTVLTVLEGRPNSHKRRGWESFTDAVIRAVNEKPERVVFLLWGGEAQRKARLVTNPEHVVIRAAHPAARASAKKQLVGSGVFSEANEALREKGRGTIDWGRSTHVSP